MATYDVSPRRRYGSLRTHHASRRLRGHDYGAPGWTFVTICTAGGRSLFGEVHGGVMGLNQAGCLAHACWSAIPDHMPRTHLGAFIVMPNHVHGLVCILPAGPPELPAYASAPVPPMHASALPGSSDVADHADGGRNRGGSTSPVAGSVSVVIGSFKSAVTRMARQTDASFAWQPRFHDHVVRSEAAFHHISAYIADNPRRWEQDVFSPPLRPPGR